MELAQPAKWKAKATTGGADATRILEEHLLCQIKATCALACGSRVAAA